MVRRRRGAPAGLGALAAALCIAVLAGMFPHAAGALPRFALREGLSCSGCHMNPTGGGQRNGYGIGSFARRDLARESDRTEVVSYDGEIGGGVRIGADLRFQLLMEQSEKTVITEEDTLTENDSRSGFHTMAAPIYASFQPARDLLFYLKYDPETAGTEAYVLIENVWGPLYVKAGAFAPDYGIRFDDHTAYTRGGDLGFITGLSRKGLLFKPNFRDSGVELGCERSWYRLTASYGNGNGGTAPFSDEKASVWRVEVRRSLLGLRTMAGVSRYGRGDQAMLAYFGGFARGRLSVLGELSSSDPFDGAVTDTTQAQAWVLEAAFELFRGIHLYTRLDNWDPDTDVSGEGFTRTILGLEWFPFPYLEIRPQYRLNGEPGSALNPERRNNVFLVQVHVYL